MAKLLSCMLLLLTAAIPFLAADAPLNGKWTFDLDTPGGARTTLADFTVTGEDVGGKWGDTPVKGTFKDSKLNLAFPLKSDEAGQTETLQVKGDLADGKIKGSWNWGGYGGTFVATRPRP